MKHFHHIIQIWFVFVWLIDWIIYNTHMHMHACVTQIEENGRVTSENENLVWIF